MSFISQASGRSLWRGIDYYQRKQVKELKKISDTIYEGKVEGSNGELYDVKIDLEHPTKSTCSCPYAEGRRIICKHKLALYFTIFPQEAEDIIKEAEEFENEREKERYNLLQKLMKEIDQMNVSEMKDLLLCYMFEEYTKYDEEDEYDFY